MTAVPNAWRGVLPHLGYELPRDVSPPGADAKPVTVNIPLALVRQSLQPREFWDIPQPVVDQYRRYRPTPLWRATGFEHAIGARVPIYVKYEGANISGSHKLNTALAQAHYYRQAGARELVTGTGAGQWGTALAAACAAVGLGCTVFMVAGSLDTKPARGTLMRLLGADVIASPSASTDLGQRHRARAAAGAPAGNSLAVAIGEAVEYAAGAQGCAFAIGSGETYSLLHQSVIGLEAADQLAERDVDVDAVVGCLGAGSNFGGIALPFFARAAAAGRPPPLLLAAESAATPKLTRGVYAYDHTDATGSGPMEAMYTIGSGYPVPESHAAGLRFHGAAKLLSAMRHRDQIAAVSVAQRAALEAGHRFTLTESILPAPESGHALAAAASLATGGVHDGGAHHVSRTGILVCVSGHGYLDLTAYGRLLDGGLTDESVPDATLRATVAALHPVDAR
jgi:tryptophan synthase beta chain